MSVYLSDENALPDAEFEPGTFEHLVPGNAGRFLDARRTPVTLVRLLPETGFYVLRIEAFEDRGAEWELPFEQVGYCQFRLGSERATAETVVRYRRTAKRLNQPLEMVADRSARDATTARVEGAGADAWLDAHSEFFATGAALPDPSSRRGSEPLARDLQAFLRATGHAEMDEAFAAQFVSNPYSGELVKGHLMILAELGLATYRGTIARDPDLFDGERARDRRAEHIVRRLAFVRAVFRRLGVETVTLYRGISSNEPLRPPRTDGLVSASFSLDVARSHFENPERNSLLIRSEIGVERILMSYLETAAMNRQFLEAEAILFAPPDGAFL